VHDVPSAPFVPFMPFVPFVPLLPFITVNELPSVQWTVAVPSWLSVSEHDVPFLPAEPLLPEQPPASAAPNASVKAKEVGVACRRIVPIMVMYLGLLVLRSGSRSLAACSTCTAGAFGPTTQRLRSRGDLRPLEPPARVAAGAP
jgi:hypothetical protein